MRQQLLEEADYRCGYCLSTEVLSGIPLTVDHILPIASGGSDEIDNLWMACRPCNEIKGVQTESKDVESGETVPLFNPRFQSWREHFEWDETGTIIIGKTSIGRATLSALGLNRDLLVKARSRWVAAGWHPPDNPIPGFNRLD